MSKLSPYEPQKRFLAITLTRQQWTTLDVAAMVRWLPTEDLVSALIADIFSDLFSVVGHPPADEDKAES